MNRSDRRDHRLRPRHVPVTAFHRRRARIAAVVAMVAVGGCAVSDERPAWERGAVGKPSAAADSKSAVGAFGSSAAAAPGKATGSPTERKSVERVTLPLPGSADKGDKPVVAPAPAASTPASTAASAKAASSVAPAQTAVPAVASSQAAVPAAASSQAAVSAGAPIRSSATKQTIDPLWLGAEIYTAKYEDTLIDLAPPNHLGFIEIAMANPGVDPWLPGEGTPIVLPKMHLQPDAHRDGIVLNLPEQRLYYYQKGALVSSYPIGIGRDGHATPVGSTKIVRKQVGPSWYPTPTARADDPTLPAVMPPGPDNPLGTHAMYLGWSAYLIHGTNKEFGIGRRASRGCIRMYPDDIITLFNKVPVGTPVQAIDQPIKIGWHEGELYIEASATIAQVQQWEENGKFDPVAPPNLKEAVTAKAGKSADRVDWAVVDRVVAERRGIPTRITRPAPGVAVATAASTAAPPAPAALAPANPPATSPSANPLAATASPTQLVPPPAPAKSTEAPAQTSVQSSVPAPAPKTAVPAPGSAAPVAAAKAPAAPAPAADTTRPGVSQADDQAEFTKWLRSRLANP